jgi:hypothetical protein
MDVLPLFAYDEIGNIVRESTNASTAVDLSSDPLRDKYISASRTSGYHLENYLDDEVFKFVIPLISSEATRSALNACILVKGDCIVGAYAERRGSSPEILSLKEASAELNSDN